MSGVLLLVAWLAPLAALLPALGKGGRWWAFLAALPALAAALLVPVGTVLEVPWLLLGMQLGLDATGRLVLLFSSILWLFAALYAALTHTHDPRARRFDIFFLLAMAGNLLLILAADMVSFYFGFALFIIASAAELFDLGCQRLGSARVRPDLDTIESFGLTSNSG